MVIVIIVLMMIKIQGVPKKASPKIQKKKCFFTKSYHRGMEENNISQMY